MTEIAEGECVFDKSEWMQLVAELGLPPRQTEIVQHLFLGQSDKQIAQTLGLALPTIRTHLGRIFTRFNVQDRHELILHVFHHFRRGCRSIDCPRQALHQKCRLEEIKHNEDNLPQSLADLS